MTKILPFDSDAELNLLGAKPIEMLAFFLIFVFFYVKYVIIIYALGLAYEKFGVWIKAVPKPKFPAEPGGKNGWAVLNWNSHSQLIQTPNFSCT